MPIYDLFDQLEQKHTHQSATISHLDLLRDSQKQSKAHQAHQAPDVKNRLFTALAARLFFFALFFVDLVWGVWSLLFFFTSLALNLLLGFKVVRLKRFFARRYLNVKRGAVCAIALLVSLFSPALGTMFACSYFLMYDKKGVKEIVPTVLQDQFNEFFPS